MYRIFIGKYAVLTDFIFLIGKLLFALHPDKLKQP